MSFGRTTAFQARIKASSCSSMDPKGRGRPIVSLSMLLCPKWVSAVKKLLAMTVSEIVGGQAVGAALLGQGEGWTAVAIIG